MSRSYKKNPVIAIACCGKGKQMKSAKTNAVRKVRRTILDDIPNGSHFKKMDERYTWPDDGKQWSDNYKAYRK